MLKRHIIYAIILVLLAGGLDLLFEHQLRLTARDHQHIDVTNNIATIRAKIEKEIVQNLSLVYGTANYVSVHPTLSREEFIHYARGVIQKDNLLLNIAAAPNFVLSYVYPIRGNESIVGVDYRTLPNQWAQVNKAVKTGQMVIAGPLKLMQGGTGLIGRAPVYIHKGSTLTLWGLISAVIDADRLYKRAGLLDTTTLQIAIRGIDGTGFEGDVFWGDESVFSPEAEPILSKIETPSGSWGLAAIPVNGWSNTTPFAWPIRGTFATVTLIILILFYKESTKRQRLIKTQILLREAQQIAKLGNWQLEVKTGELWWSDEMYNIFKLDKGTFSPTIETVFDHVHPEDRARVIKEFDLFRDEGDIFTIEHRFICSDSSVGYLVGQGVGEKDTTGKLIALKGTVLDITERHFAQEQLLNEQQKIQAMAEASYDPLVMIDAQGAILFWSPAAERLYGWTETEAIGRNMHSLIAPEEYFNDATEGLQRFSVTGKGPVMESIMEFDSIKKDGTIVPVERSVSAFKMDGNYYAVGILRDITDRRKYQEELEFLARTDKMTGINNRAYFLELLDKECDRSDRFKHDLSIIMFDADKFKHINDAYGHDVGDDVLIRIVNTVKHTIRDLDIIGRLGGEEFAILLLDTHEIGAMIAAEHVRKAIEEQSLITKAGDVIKFTVSLGVAQYVPDSGGSKPLLKLSDQALYHAKRNGRNRSERASNLNTVHPD